MRMLATKTEVKMSSQLASGRNGAKQDNAPINVNPVGGGGGGVRARGGDLTKEQKFWSISRGWGSIRSSNVVKNPHLDISFQKHKLKSEYMPLL